MDALLLLGLVFVGVFGIQHIINMQRLANAKAVLQQVDLEKIGRPMAWLGSISAVALPRLFHVRYQNDDQSTLIASVLYAVGFTIMFIGFKFRIAAYKTKEETPNWIRTLAGELLRLWASFWGDNTK